MVRILGDLPHQYDHPLGWVSIDIPLISNLNVWVNIALIKQYHENLPVDQAAEMARQLLRRFQMESIFYRRNPHLTEEERFCAMVLRAAMVPQGILILDRPFEILSSHGDSRFLHQVLCTVNDMFTKCYIFDYTWEKKNMGSSMKLKREFKVGLFVLLTTLLIVISISYVAYKKGVFESEHAYNLYSISGEGLTEGMPVLFSGFKIGKVTKLELNDKGMVFIRISVLDRHTKWLRQNSQFAMVRPVIGTARINVYTADLAAPPLAADSQSEVLIVDDINELINKAQPIVAKLDQTVANIEQITANLAGQNDNINKIIGNTERVSANFANKKSVAELVLGEEESVRSIHESIRHLNSILKNTDEQFHSPEGTLALVNNILKDILLKLDKLNTTVDNINQISTNASDSTKDLKLLRSEIDATVTAVKNLSRKIDGILSSGKEKEILLP